MVQQKWKQQSKYPHHQRVKNAWEHLCLLILLKTLKGLYMCRKVTPRVKKSVRLQDRRCH